MVGLQNMNMVKNLSNVETWIMDVLPQRVPENSKGQYFRIEQYYLGKKRIGIIRQKQVDVILKLKDPFCIFHEGCLHILTNRFLLLSSLSPYQMVISFTSVCVSMKESRAS